MYIFWNSLEKQENIKGSESEMCGSHYRALTWIPSSEETQQGLGAVIAEDCKAGSKEKKEQNFQKQQAGLLGFERF